MDRHNLAAPRLALTFVELSISLAVLGMIGLSVAAIGTTASRGWLATASDGSLRGNARKAGVELSLALRRARLVSLSTQTGMCIPDASAGVVQTPSTGAGLALWTPARDVTTDLVLASELSLIEHSTADGTLTYYELADGASEVVLSIADMESPSGRQTFKGLPGITSRVIARGVRSARFTARADAAGRQTVEYVLELEDDSGERRTELGTTWLRAAIDWRDS